MAAAATRASIGAARAAGARALRGVLDVLLLPHCLLCEAAVDAQGSLCVYRPRLVGHLVAAYAARAAVESWSCRTALGGRNPCRSMSQVAL